MLTITNSPDISALSFMALFDISQVTPHIVLTNYSTGSNLAGCSWWYVIKTPSGTFIHQGSVTSPDATGVWSPITVPDPWPQPYGEIEFSGAPYSVELFVKDSANNIYSEKLEQMICRPYGCKEKTKGNFGVASVQMDIKCESAKLFVNDNTNYSYKGNSGTNYVKKFVVDYPLDATGARPAQFVLNGFQNALVPVPYSSNDYTLYLDSVVEYPFANGITVKVKYKLTKKFHVWCDIDLCPLTCAFTELIQEIEQGKCTTADYQTVRNNLQVITAKMTLALVAKAQPGCGIDLPALIQEIKDLTGINCDCTIGSAGNNGTLSPNAPLNYEVNVTCGDITGDFEVTDDNVILNIADISYIFKICDDAPTDAFTIEESTNGCVKTYCFNVDLDKLKDDLNIPEPVADICVSVYLHGTTNTPPPQCPGSFFPAYIWDHSNTANIGLANDAVDMINILNNNSTWTVKGVAQLVGNCRVCFKPNNGIASINPIYITPFLPGNPPTPGFYDVQVNDYCQPTIAKPLSAFPQNIYVSYTAGGGGVRYYVGYATSYTDMITKLQAEPNKPVAITLSAASNTNPLLTLVHVVDVNTPANKQVYIFGDKSDTLLIGGNSNYGAPLDNSHGNIDEVYLDNNARIGSVCAATLPFYKPWHSMKVGNTLFYIESDTGTVWPMDITNPLSPVRGTGYGMGLLASGSPNTPFSGVPALSAGKPSHWDVYFPTDYNAQLDGSFTYIVESTSGTIYKYDTASKFVVGAFYSNALLGMCPRCIVNNKLYLTRDGSRGTLAGAGALNLVPATHLVYVDLLAFNAGAVYPSQVISSGTDEVWAMSIDTNQLDIAYCTTKVGDVYKYDLAADSPLARYTTVTPSLATADLINTSINNNRIFISAYGIGTFQCQVANLGSGSAVVFDNLHAYPGADVVGHFNFRALPNSCFGILTYDNGSSNGGVAKYSLDGKLQGYINFNGSMYNVESIQNVPFTTPNSLCP